MGAFCSTLTADTSKIEGELVKLNTTVTTLLSEIKSFQTTLGGLTSTPTTTLSPPVVTIKS